MILMNLKQRKYKINRNEKLTAAYTPKGMDIDAIILNLKLWTIIQFKQQPFRTLFHMQCLKHW